MVYVFVENISPWPLRLSCWGSGISLGGANRATLWVHWGSCGVEKSRKAEGIPHGQILGSDAGGIAVGQPFANLSIAAS